MKPKTIMLLGVAVVCGLVAMIGVRQVMSGPTETEEQPETIQVLVATGDIEPFAPLDESNTGFKTVPTADVPEGAVTSREECVDRMLRYGVVENDVILATKLTEKNHSPSDEIPDGMRVVTVKVNQTKTHSGLIRPGDNVDVVLTYDVQKAGQRPSKRTLTILQNVKVFATDNVRRVTGRETDNGDINAKNMSLIVEPSDANMLMLAESRGQLTMALRKEGEPVRDDIKPLSDDIFEEMHQAKNGGVKKEEKPAAKKTEPKPEKKTLAVSLENEFQRYLASTAKQAEEKKAADKKAATIAKIEKKPESVKIEQPKPVKKQYWKLTIFTGSTKRVEEIELLDDETTDQKIPATLKRQGNIEGPVPAPRPAKFRSPAKV